MRNFQQEELIQNNSTDDRNVITIEVRSREDLQSASEFVKEFCNDTVQCEIVVSFKD
ncbi:uncharacterized protein METZ01_LOCUS379738 [marine metagenome]|uniref:Uncharacterized protein n=1 Tax=marine metagenome TaxID=408172 RepID=A0A382TXU2_9ZZZZ